MCGKTCFGRSWWPWNLLPRLGWDRVLQSKWGHGYLSLAFVVRFLQVALTVGFTVLLVILVHRILWALIEDSRSQWPRGLRSRSAAYRLLKLWVRIQGGHGWMSICCERYVLSDRSLRRADHSSRGVLSTMVRRCVWSRIFLNEEALSRWGLSRQKQTKCEDRSTMGDLYQGLTV